MYSHMEIVPTQSIAACLLIDFYEGGAFVLPNTPGIYFQGFEFELYYPSRMPEDWDWVPIYTQGTYVLMRPQT